MSTTSVVDARTAGRPAPLALATIALAMLAALAFIALAAAPYASFLGGEEAARRALDEVQFAIYWPRRGWLLVHILGGLVALLSGPVQLWLGLSDRRMEFHRRLGLCYIGGMTAGVAGAVGLAVQSPLGWVFRTGLLALAVAWTVTTLLAYSSIRRSLIDQHKEWMIRSYVVTFAFVTFRVLQIGMVGAGLPIERVLDFASWASWAVPLVATEAVLQGRKIFAVTA